MSRHYIKRCFSAVLVLFVVATTSSQLSAHHEPLDIGIEKTAKIVNKHNDRYEKFVAQSRTNKSKCEKYYKRGWKYLMESPDALWMKPSKMGNYPNSSSIGVVSKWSRHMGIISLKGCPDSSLMTQDFVRAHQFFEMGAFQYDEESMYQLGLLYINGQGVSKNETIGLSWVNMAAAEWSENARNFLANNGYSVPQKVLYQTKMLIANETHGDNVGTQNYSELWKWVGVLSVVAIGVYASYKLAPANTNPTVSAMQQTTLQATTGVTNAFVSSKPAPANTNQTVSAMQQKILPAITGVIDAFTIPTLCPDGSYHPQGMCLICPDGTYTTAPTCQITPKGYYIGDYGSGSALTPQGDYIPRASSTVFCPDGRTHPGNWCQLAPNGSYIGSTR